MKKIKRIETDERSSRVVIYNGVVSVGGITAPNRDCDIKDQTRQVLSRIDDYLNKAGTNKSRLLTAQIWLKDIERDFAAMNEVWNDWTSSGSSPTRATVQSDMADPKLLVEVVVTAAEAN